MQFNAPLRYHISIAASPPNPGALLIRTVVPCSSHHVGVAIF